MPPSHSCERLATNPRCFGPLCRRPRRSGLAATPAAAAAPAPAALAAAAALAVGRRQTIVAWRPTRRRRRPLHHRPLGRHHLGHRPLGHRPLCRRPLRRCRRRRRCRGRRRRRSRQRAVAVNGLSPSTSRRRRRTRRHHLRRHTRCHRPLCRRPLCRRRPCRRGLTAPALVGATAAAPAAARRRRRARRRPADGLRLAAAPLPRLSSLPPGGTTRAATWVPTRAVAARGLSPPGAVAGWSAVGRRPPAAGRRPPAAWGLCGVNSVSSMKARRWSRCEWRVDSPRARNKL